VYRYNFSCCFYRKADKRKIEETRYGPNKEEGGTALEMMEWKEVAPRFILQGILVDLNEISFAVSANILHLWTNSSDL
jgi:hypothetical protein